MTIKAYKGFYRDMTCRGFKYEEGKEYETDKAVICKTGFHACEYPLDCLSYYSPNTSEYHEVIMDGDTDRENYSHYSKFCATKIKIGAKLDIADLVKAAISFTMEKANKETGSDKIRGAASATGECGAASATGNYGAASADNPTAVAVAWGHRAKAKGCIGAHLVLPDWQENIDNDWELNGAKMVVVDGEEIKADTYYRCTNGEVVEAEND